MHSVLRNFVDTACRWFLMKPEKLIERPRAFADSVAFFDGLEHVRLRQNQRFAKLLP